jgi:hypothetical protein
MNKRELLHRTAALVALLVVAATAFTVIKASGQATTSATEQWEYLAVPVRAPVLCRSIIRGCVKNPMYRLYARHLHWNSFWTNSAQTVGSWWQLPVHQLIRPTTSSDGGEV